MPSLIDQKEDKQEEYIGLQTEATALADKSENDLTDEDLERVPTLTARLTELTAEITKLQDDIETANEAREQLRAVAQGGGRSPARRQRMPSADPRSRVDVGDDLSDDDPSCGFKSPRDFLMAVMGTTRSGRLDMRLEPLRIDLSMEELQIEAAVGSDEQSTFSDPYGGFLVPETFQPTMLSISPEADPFGSRVTQVPMTTPTLKLPYRVDKDHSTSVSGGLRFYRRAEADTVTASRMQVKLFSLEANSLMGIAYATEEILTDSAISFIALLEQGFRDEYVSTLIKERLTGTGVGEFQGIMISDALLTIGAEDAQAVSTIVYANIVKMRARVWGYQDAIWLANHDTLPQLMTLTNPTGPLAAPIWQPSAREDHPDILFGRPLVLSEYPASIGGLGDLTCINATQYLEGTLQSLQGASSIHVRFVNHERTFKFFARNAGACWWDSPLTPVNGATLSPFVTLEARE